MATIRCLPNGFDGEEKPIFKQSSLQELECGITLLNLSNAPITKRLPGLEILTSQPELLTEKDIEVATELLSTINTDPNKTVRQLKIHCCSLIK